VERRGRRRGKNEGVKSRALLGVIVVFVYRLLQLKRPRVREFFMNVFCLVNMSVFPSHPTQLTSNALYQMTILTAGQALMHPMFTTYAREEVKQNYAITVQIHE
jgi:hypothetical protein